MAWRTLGAALLLGMNVAGLVVAIAARVLPVNAYEMLGEGRIGWDCDSIVAVGALWVIAVAVIAVSFPGVLMTTAGTRLRRLRAVCIVVTAIAALLLASIVPSWISEYRDNHEPGSPCMSAFTRRSGEGLA